MISFFHRLKDGIAIMSHAIRVLFAYPILLVPILFCWLVYGPLVLYLAYLHPWDSLSFGGVVWSVFGPVILLPFVLTFSCHVLLEMIQQIETDQDVDLMHAAKDAANRNMVKSLPIVLIWSVLWLILTILDLIISGKDVDSPNTLTLGNTARTLSGDASGLMLSRSFFRLLNKAVRMAMYLTLSSIAWEDTGPHEAIKRGFSALRKHTAEFATGFVSSELIATVVFLPVGVFILSVVFFEIVVSTPAWVILIVYIAIAWSFSLYIEQMLAAGLYLWHLKWLRVIDQEAESGLPLPTLRDVGGPSILDGIPEFAP